MANVISAVKQPAGTVLVTYDDNTTRVMSADQAKANGIKVSSGGISGPASGTGYNNTAGTQFPSTDNKVLINGKETSVTDAVAQANDVKKLAIIRKNLLASGQLTKAEAKSPTSLLSKWAEIVYGAANDSDPNNKDPFNYAKSLQQAGFQSTTGVQQYEPYAQQTIYDPTKAASFITDQFQSIYHRNPTETEIKNWTDKLKNEQLKAKSAAKTTYKVINGVRTAQVTTGLDEAQWLKGKLMGTKEYKDVQNRLNSAAAQTLQGAAAANGIKLDNSQLVDWINRVKAGENIETFKSILRDQAALGMPEPVKKLLGQGVDLQSIYSPYKQVMANVLEVNPATIGLDDPVLRSAINQTGETSIYDFQRALRKDPRWQYTNNAREEVSNSVSQVLKDFGFMG